MAGAEPIFTLQPLYSRIGKKNTEEFEYENRMNNRKCISMSIRCPVFLNGGGGEGVNLIDL